MKKSVIAVLTTAAAVTVLSACAPSAPDLSMPTTDRTNGSEQAATTLRQEENTASTEMPMYKTVIHGAVRKVFDPSGVYTTEYMHFSPSYKPEILPTYSLELKDDNTFTFHADVNGVVSDHYGNYYVKHGGSLILFYDEPIDTSPHNVYVADSMYMELLPHGKIMFYDNCGTIVLSKSSKTQARD